ncbi:MAG: HEAT repeat domain-containing protein [Methyloglobulus sp.]|nr:HEAT repeat domain-containing protein [Methyloglobulus sp.]
MPTNEVMPLYRLVMAVDKGSEVQLEVRQMTLAQALDSITQQTQVPIHYSVLPEGLVTATCVGANLKYVLECLLNKKADLVVRYPSNPVRTINKNQVAEAWVLGSRLDGYPVNQTNCVARPGEQILLTLKQKHQETEEAEQTEQLLNLAQSKDPAERADAIGSLLAIGRSGDPDIKAALEQALTDQDPMVRAQAISTLAHREGNAATTAIEQAMQDDSVDVRMMAVDGITDDVALLRQAINDSDETIRSLAQTKLEALGQTNNTPK